MLRGTSPCCHHWLSPLWLRGHPSTAVLLPPGVSSVSSCSCHSPGSASVPTGVLWWQGRFPMVERGPSGMCPCVLGPEPSIGCRARGAARILGQPFCLQHQPCSQCLPAAVLSKQECARAEPGRCPTVPTAQSGSGRSRAGAPQGSAGTGCSRVSPVWTGAQESFQGPNSEVFFRCCGIWSLQVQ